MKKIEKQILIEKNINTVWNLFGAEEGKIKNLNPNIFEVEFISKTDNIVGTKYKTKSDFSGKIIESNHEIVSFKDEESWKKFEVKNEIAKKENTMRIVELTTFEGNQNRTLLKVTMTIEPVNIFNKFTSLFNKVEEKLNLWLEDVKRIAEAEK